MPTRPSASRRREAQVKEWLAEAWLVLGFNTFHGTQARPISRNRTRRDAPVRDYLQRSAALPPAQTSAAIAQNIAPAPSTEPNAQNTSGSTTWLLFMIVVRTPSASPTRPAGEREWSSDMTLGWAAPSPRPRKKATSISGASDEKNGKSTKAIVVLNSVYVSTCHSVKRRESSGMASRMVKVASAKQPS